MVNLGDTAKAINAKKFQVFIGSSAGNEWKLVQNATVMLSHPVFREPTTGNYLIRSGGIPQVSTPLSGSTEFAQLFVVGNTGSSPVITRDGSDGFPALSSW